MRPHHASPLPEVADFPDKDGWARRQPFAGIYPGAHLPIYDDVRVCDVGEDNEMLILGHVGKRRAVVVFWKRIEALCGRGDANSVIADITDHDDLSRAAEMVRHRWATHVTRCATYPACGSLGPVSDGKPCHDVEWAHAGDPPASITAYDDHDWAGWTSREEDLTTRWHTPKMNGAVRLRCCYRCDLHQAEKADGTVHTADFNRCPTCLEIDGSGDLYFRWDATPDDPRAFPVTVWAV